MKQKLSKNDKAIIRQSLNDFVFLYKPVLNAVGTAKILFVKDQIMATSYDINENIFTLNFDWVQNSIEDPKLQDTLNGSLFI